MNKLDVNELIEARKLAKVNFPKYFNLESSDAYTYNEFKADYIKYLEAYFNDEFDIKKKEEIKKAYNYINLIFLRKNNIKGGIVGRMWNTYLALNAQIREYRFDAKNDNSKGAIQNKTNDQILDELSLLEPLVFEICMNIKIKLDSNISSALKQELIIKLDGLCDNLTTYLDQLYDTGYNYYKSLVNFEDNSYYKNSGISRNEWRKSRNEACFALLNFISELIEIDISMYYNTFEYKDKEYGLDAITVQKINFYNQFLKYLRKSNNYFCYLDDAEKQELVMQKCLKYS